MLCDNCKIDRLVSDFINSKNICYKCMYRIKVEKSKENRTSESRYCKECGYGKNICYRCVYRMKLEACSEKKKEKSYTCRTCKCAFTPASDQKKRQRTVFCSEECAKKGHQNQLNNHWTRRIPK